MCLSSHLTSIAESFLASQRGRSTFTAHSFPQLQITPSNESQLHAQCRANTVLTTPLGYAAAVATEVEESFPADKEETKHRN